MMNNRIYFERCKIAEQWSSLSVFMKDMQLVFLSKAKKIKN